jgi:alkylation response protein AidB-like acyl-CoA dehydrogenase
LPQGAGDIGEFSQQMMNGLPQITSTEHSALDELCAALAKQADATGDRWPDEQLRLCGAYGVYRWFVREEDGGFGWTDAQIAQGYIRLSAACLTTSFVITQRTGALQRIAGMAHPDLKSRWLPDLLSGERFATIGISHLTTSRRYLKAPVLRAELTDDYVQLDGYSPWVTGAAHADVVVIGASTDDGQQVLVALPTELNGVTAPAPTPLIALSGSHTGSLECRNVRVPRGYLLAGPAENVMAQRTGGNTGGLQTSALAIGLSRAAVRFMEREAERREELGEATQSLAREVSELQADLLARASGGQDCTLEELRARANSVVLRSTQAALAAAKGAGFVDGHPVGRWCREALFFLVWSCPQPVVNAALCELAGLNVG